MLASTEAERVSGFYQSALSSRQSDNVVDDAGDLLRIAFPPCGDELHGSAVFQGSSKRCHHPCCEAADWEPIRECGDQLARPRVNDEWGPAAHGPGDNLLLFIHDLDGACIENSGELEFVAPNRPVREWPQERRTLNRWRTAPLRIEPRIPTIEGPPS